MSQIQQTVEVAIGPARFAAVVVENEAYITQRQMAELFGVDRKTVTEHLGAIFAEQECSPEATSRKFQLVRTEGNRSVSREVEHYSSLVVQHVGYRVKSDAGVQFRQWVSQVVRGEKSASIELSPVAAVAHFLAQLSPKIQAVFEELAIVRSKLHLLENKSTISESQYEALRTAWNRQAELEVALGRRPTIAAARGAIQTAMREAVDWGTSARKWVNLPPDKYQWTLSVIEKRRMECLQQEKIQRARKPRSPATVTDISAARSKLPADG